MLAICVAAFIFANVLLAFLPWFPNELIVLIMLSIPLSQCSLVVLWAATTKDHPVMRFVWPAVVIVASWFVLMRIMPWGVGEPASAGWAMALLIQILAIFGMVKIHGLSKGRRLDMDFGESSHSSSGLGYDLRTLMLWTTIIALTFGFIQYARVRWGWSASVADWEYIALMPLFAFFNALLAVIWAWALGERSRQRRFIGMMIAPLMVGILVIATAYASDWMVGIDGLTIRQLSILAAVESVLIAGTIALLLFVPARWEFRMNSALDLV